MHYRQANDRLKAIDRRRFEGLTGMEQYREERREILNFLTGTDQPSESAQEPTPLPIYQGDKRRWWWSK